MSLVQNAKTLLAKVLFHPTVGRLIASLKGDRISSGRFLIHTDASIITPHTKAQIFWGSYESGEIRMAERHLRSDLDLIEIGSSIGILSSHAIGQIDPSNAPFVWKRTPISSRCFGRTSRRIIPIATSKLSKALSTT